MKPWDGLTIGGPILSDTYFGGGYTSDFSQPLDGGKHSGGIIGTTKGWEGDHYNFTYPTDGQFKLGGHLQCHQTYANSYNYPNASDQRNKETQHYVHPHGDNPDPLDLFELRGGQLVMKARPVLESEREWARIKGYVQNSAGQEATYGELAAEGFSIPSDWAPSDTREPTDSKAFFLNMGNADFLCPMLSTYNRRSMSFGRSACRVMVPVGARLNGDANDLRNIDTWFPAIWDLEDVPARCDINGRWHDKDTYTPANPAAGDNLHELDQAEFFGYSNTDLHVTSHVYKEGTNNGYIVRAKDSNGDPVSVYRVPQTQVNHTGGNRADLSSPAYPDVGAIRGQFIEVGVDRYPAGGEDFPDGVIVYWANGKVVAMYAMEPHMSAPKAVYEPLGVIPYLPYLDINFNAKKVGVQAYEDGNPAYMHWCQIFNIATNAGFTRGLSKTPLLNGTAPTFRESEEMILDWVIMQPLIDENPDTQPFIDYSAGDFGGSGDDPYTVELPVDPNVPIDPGPDVPVEPDPEPTDPYNPDPDVPIGGGSPVVSTPKAPTNPNQGSHFRFTDHDWFTLMRGLEPDALIKERPGFVFSNGRSINLPRDFQKKTVSDEDND